ncbi:type II toxin-antitoxin system PemK/MazF family toxin [Methanoculleus sp. FWC-SCC1]|uniref:Type II toxin-antitoxin system PemK/MazF family toxin n=1 Tax=Methanoculleus frigidifontis TaxID=2584085 RepID=A0ABT8MCW1_9EURY|nr:type II toxin-antitoxin system PemK/MazF family toxin [Methanoculleus sp. FWC-SCC1]MDN7025789.1 type II toxin-antitoxin system PemK/MazF family toxin [Methanoculleus sp. FWC-SCC1]
MRRSRGDIWFVDLTDARGHEQSGLRPAVVLAVAYGGMTIVVPLTTTAAAFSFPHTHGIEKSSQNGLTSHSAALVFQIVALSEDRFVRKTGRCSVEDMEAISVLLKDLLALE